MLDRNQFNQFMVSLAPRLGEPATALASALNPVLLSILADSLELVVP